MDSPAPPPARRARAPRALAVLVLAVLPLALRLGAIDHGAPRGYVPDAHVVRAALGMARDRDPVPPVNRYSSYPNLVPYLLVPVYAAQYVAGRASGRWASADEYGAVVLEEPAVAHLPARIVVALLGALTAWVVLRAARAAGLGRGAWVAAWLVAAGTLHVHFSVQERPWVPMVLAMAACAWAAARHEREGRARDLHLAALAAAAAVSCHQAGAVSVGLVALAWALSPRGWRGRDLRARLAHGVGCALLFCAVALVVGHPYLLVHGRTPAEGVIGGEQAGSVSLGGQQFLYRFRAASAARLGTALVGYDPLVALLFLPGLVLALRRRGLRALALFVGGWALLFGTNYNDHVRYLLPIVVLGAIPAGLAAERCLRSRAAVIAAAPLLAVPLVQSLRLVVLLDRPDTRALAEARLVAGAEDGSSGAAGARDEATGGGATGGEAKGGEATGGEAGVGEAGERAGKSARGAGAVVAIDRYGPDVPLTLAALERLAGLRERAGAALYRREAYRRERLRAAAGGAPLPGPPPEPGADAVPLEDLFLATTRAGDYLVRPGLEDLGATPREALRALGVTHVVVAARAPAELAEHPLLAELSLGTATPLWVVDPSIGARRAAGARLPTELDFALRDLWAVERPGPWLGLYALDP